MEDLSIMEYKRNKPSQQLMHDVSWICKRQVKNADNKNKMINLIKKIHVHVYVLKYTLVPKYNRTYHIRMNYG